MKYKQDVAFINRERELEYLSNFIDKKPSEILFVHGPKSSGKTILLYRFFDRIQKEQKVDVKFLNLREILIVNYKDFLKTFFGIDYALSKNNIKETRKYDLKIFKLTVEALKGLESGQIDPFSVMKCELIKLNEKGIKPVIIIDELQALEHIYINDQRELIKELFNFFVAITKESHLAHVIISSSDGYFIDTIYKESKLKKTSKFFKVDYLSREDVFEWLLNLQKYSKIEAYTLSDEDIEKIWDTVGGSMWEIQSFLTDLFSRDLDDILHEYKKLMKAMIDDYIGFDSIKESALKIFSEESVWGRANLKTRVVLGEQDLESVLNKIVTNNILYYDPTEAIFYPQGKSMEWGIKLYFQSTT